MVAKMMCVVMGLGMSLLTSTLWADQSSAQAPPTYGHGDTSKLPSGMIGAVIEVVAEHIGEPAALYVIKVRQDGPAQQAGLRHGDEIVAVNGSPVRGKSYEQVVSMIRGEAGTPVKLEVRGIREVSIKRVASDKLMAEEQSEAQDGQRE